MSESFFCQRPDLGLLQVAGSDARGFLHAQTTQAIDQLADSTTRPAAWLNAKGRVRALFDVVTLDDSFWLITASDNVEWLADQLRFFVLRSKVSLNVVTTQSVYSCGGDLADWLATHAIAVEPGAVAADADAVWVNSGSGCIEVFGEPEKIRARLADLPGGEVDRAIALQIANGRPTVPASLRERYVPQMLNLEKLGAISFNKGCYPGQEIVARTENLGEVKRRLKRFTVGQGPKPAAGDVIVDDRSTAIGEVNCAAAAESGYELLAVVKLDSNEPVLKIQSDGRELKPLDLPYA